MTNNNQPKKNRLKPIRNFIVKNKTYFLLAVAVPATYCFLIIFFTKCFGMEVTEVASVVNGLFGAVSIIAVFITIRIQSQEMRDNREQLTRTANAQEGSNKFFQEQLRIANLPRLSCSLTHETYQNFDEDKLNSSFSVINSGKDCYSLYIDIIHIHQDGKHKYHSDRIEYLAENEKIDCRLDKWEPNYEILIRYRDVLGNSYASMLIPTLFPTGKIPRLIPLHSHPTIPNKDKYEEMCEIWKKSLKATKAAPDPNLFKITKDYSHGLNY